MATKPNRTVYVRKQSPFVSKPAVNVGPQKELRIDYR
jgi:hypothetical protein